ncbi:MAG: GspE/PulE family protein [Chromatiales bacterium]|jgi:type IV pilus assembly protein PilB|nr:GspE/PulE family protein [Chromatiales bacterium]
MGVMAEIDGSVALCRWVRERAAHPRAALPLGQLLLGEGLIDAKQLEQALQVQREGRGRHLGRILIEQGTLDQHQVFAALALKFGIPRVRPESMQIAPEILGLIPADLATRHAVIPLARFDGTLIVAMPNPFDTELLELLRFNTGLAIAPAFARRESIALAHARYYSQFDEEAASLSMRLRVAEEDDTTSAEQAANQGPIVRLLESVLHEGVLLRASDINIRPEGSGVAIHYRVDGKMRRVRTLSSALLAPLVSRIKIIGQMNIAERRLAQEGSAHFASQGREVDLRISVIPTVGGESVVIRLLDRQTALRELSALELPAAEEQRLRRIIAAPHGLFLVCGPTGAGKSTTLYALLNELRASDAHILTVEDPVEYHMNGIEQVQIADRIGYTFAEVLRRFLRHDPDVILVGEIRDAETAAIACRAALTGHFVLSSLHTNDAPSAVARLIDMGVAPYVLAATLRGVMAQRLLRLRCQRCDGAKQNCPTCGGSGHVGRRIVCEVLKISPTICEFIERKASLQELSATAQQEGMVRLQTHAMALAEAGLISQAEALALGT